MCEFILCFSCANFVKCLIIIKSKVDFILISQTEIPASARDVHYLDYGHIYSGSSRMRNGSIEVELEPRFPLLLGGKIHYVLGYSVPTQEYLYNYGIYLFLFNQNI